jgi:hypothetical protein
MTSIHLQESLSGIPGIRGFAQCDAHGALLFSSGDAAGPLYGSAPRILHLAAELGFDLGLGTLREAELHGSMHALCVPCEGGAVSVEAGSRATLSDVSQRLHAVLA